jgi:hypothetical protein
MLSFVSFVVTSDVSDEDDGKGKKKVGETRAAELRRQMQLKLKQRLELKEKNAGGLQSGDPRSSLKKPMYTSKTSLHKQE